MFKFSISDSRTGIHVCVLSQHYEYTPMQYTENFISLEIEILIEKKKTIFNIHVQNIDFGYTLEPTRRSGSNEYQQSMFWINNNKKGVICYHGMYGYTCFPYF